MSVPLPEGVARHIAREAPEPLRIAAARGALPLPPAERLEVLHRLFSDPSPSVRAEAERAWADTPRQIVLQALSDGRLSPELLDRIADTRGGDRRIALAVLEHPAATPSTLGRFAGSSDPEILERVARNQRVLLADPGLATRLLENPRLPVAERSRLEALFGRPEPEPPGEPGEEESPAPDDALPQGLPPALVDDEVEPTEAERQNLYTLVRSMSVAEKIRLAMLGSKSARRLLVRDTNKAVLRAVVQSPKIREDEVLALAQDRTMPEEIIRMILGRRDWMKSYPIRLALCQNPKTPAARALRLLETLQDRDLRQIARSRNVPAPVAAGATRILARRGKL